MVKHTYEEVKNYIESVEGYILLSTEYKNAITKLKIMNNVKGIIKNPETNKSLELDIYLPEIKKAIEFNGIYWHSKDTVKRRDKIKNQECKNKNIQVLTINEENFVNNKKGTFNLIQNFIIDRYNYSDLRKK